MRTVRKRNMVRSLGFLLIGALLIITMYFAMTANKRIITVKKPALIMNYSFNGDLSFGRISMRIIYVKNFKDNEDIWNTLKNYGDNFAASQKGKDLIIVFFFDTKDCPPIGLYSPLDYGEKICWNKVSVRIPLAAHIVKLEKYNKHYIALFCKCHNQEEFIKYPQPLPSLQLP